ncbi:HEAT repeat domain-containing protein [Synechococcus elongatus]|uniref:HEAT repeat domain-containing protein n=1 Tax=Synechococcus elongatus PCC 11801 TaxID=2219813 RepID=A0AAN1UUZ7_SYNEL|nr:HEAT repeat domain-containing protein [Synechococcus elongatus]AZB73164.1 nitrite reductase [Synechococcus elongatus PCC 11801]
MIDATFAESAGWPVGDFEHCWRQVQQLAKSLDIRVLEDGLDRCQSNPDDWQTQWLVAYLCRLWQHDRIPAVLRTLQGLCRDGLVKTEIYRAWLAQGAIATDSIQAALEDPEERPWLLPALASHPDPAIQQLLQNFSSDPDPQWRSLAATALGSASHSHSRPRLEQLCQDPEPLVRRAALESVRFSDQFTEAERLAVLRAGAWDPDPEVVRVAVWSIAAIANSDAWNSLAMIATQSSRGRAAALAALADAGTTETLTALARLSTTAWTVPDWQACLRSLGQHPHKQAATLLLLRWLPQCPCPMDGLYSLKQLDDRTALSQLRSLLNLPTSRALQTGVRSLIQEWEQSPCA